MSTNYTLTKNGYIKINEHINWRFRIFGGDGWRNILIKNINGEAVRIELYDGTVCYLNQDDYILNENQEKIKIINLKPSMKIYKHLTTENLIIPDKLLLNKLVHLIDNYGKEYKKGYDARYMRIIQDIKEYNNLYDMVMKLKGSGFNINIFNRVSEKRFVSNGIFKIDIINFVELIVKSDALNKLFLDFGYKLKKINYDINNNIDCEESEYHIIKKINITQSDYLYSDVIYNINGIVIFNE